MKHYQNIKCTHCESEDIVKNGHSENGTQRWRCNKCKKSFQLTYERKAWEVGIKEKIFELTLNSSGVRDISRTLHINRNTVMSALKKNASYKPISN